MSYLEGQQPDPFQQKLDVMAARMDELLRSKPESQDIAFQELQTAMEELTVAQEEMQQQHEQLAALHEQIEIERQRYEELFHSAPDGYIVTDTNGRIARANQAAGTLLQVPPDHLEGRILLSFLPMERRRPWRLRLAELAGSTVTREWDDQLVAREGEAPRAVSIRVVRGTATGRDGQSAEPELRWLIRDISEAASLRQRLIDTNRDLEQRVAERTSELEKAAHAKDQFLAVLSHELRTPLTPALMLVSALQHQVDLPYEVREDLSLVRRNIELETALIDDLLDLTRIARGKVALNTRCMDVHELARNVRTMAANECDRKELQVEMDLQATRHFIHADPARIQQVLWNLLSNAIKFTPPGGRIRIASENTADGSLRITVEDNGIGIEPDLLSLVFNPFQQGDQVVRQRMGGLGLGLTISRSLVDMHDGRLTVDSDGPGTGARFVMELPTIVESPADQPPEESSTTGRSLRLLIVEDHADTVRVLTKLLERMGHVAQRASTIAAAREVVASQPLDAVLCDIGLPDGSGLDLMREVTRDQSLPVIAMSGFGSERDLAETRAAGAAAHLIKPISLDRLIAAIDGVAVTDKC